MNERVDAKLKYNGLIIPYAIKLSPGTKRVMTYLFLGNMQIDQQVQWAAASCPPGVAVVPGLPHWHAKSDGSDLVFFAQCYAKSAYLALRGVSGDRVSIITESQSVPGVVDFLAAENVPVDSLVIIQPLGLTADVFRMANDPLAEFMRRIRNNLYYQRHDLLTDRKLMSNHMRLFRNARGEIRSSKDQYIVGLRHDSIQSIVKIMANGTHVSVLCGSHDKLFPPIEIQQSLISHNVALPIEVVPKIPHMPLSTRKGQKLLARAFEIIYSQDKEI